jgi:uncharacterized protein
MNQSICRWLFNPLQSNPTKGNKMIQIFYHKKDSDGFACAWAFNRYFDPVHLLDHDRRWIDPNEPNFQLIPFDYGDKLPKEIAETVVFADCTPTRAQLHCLVDVCEKVIIIDHHKTAWVELTNVPGVEYHYDETSAACEMVWKFLFRDKVPDLIKYVADRDLWKFVLPCSRTINLRINSYPWEFRAWDEMFAREITIAGFSNEGFAIFDFQQRMIQEAIRTQHKVILIRGEIRQEFWAIQCSTPQIISELGNVLALVLPEKRCCIYFFDGSKWQFSFRSKDEVDVGSMAKLLGGGGHRNASGTYWPSNCTSVFVDGMTIQFTWCGNELKPDYDSNKTS